MKTTRNIKETHKMNQLKKLWSIFYNYHLEWNPKADLEEWDIVFCDFLIKPDEVLEYWDHLASYDGDRALTNSGYDKDWNIKLDDLEKKSQVDTPN